MPEIKVFRAGDILNMKKNHACSKTAKQFLVLMIGSDIKVKCLGCSREMIIPKKKKKKSIKSIIPKGEN